MERDETRGTDRDPRQPSGEQRWLYLAAALGLLIVLAGAFAAARLFRGDGAEDGAVRAEPASPTPREGGVIQVDGIIVDTSRPDWKDAFREEEAQKPRYDQVINGIEVGPTVELRQRPPQCQAGDTIAPEDAEAIPELEITPAYLPEFAVHDSSEADGCLAYPLVLFEHYSIPADPAAAERISTGEMSWFEVRHGGIFHIIRRRMDEPRLRVEHIAAERWEPRTIAGMPAAIGRPIIGSLGPGMVLIWNEENGVLTQVSGDDMALEELVQIAEGLQ